MTSRGGFIVWVGEGLEFHYRPRDSEEPTKPPLKISMGCGGSRSVRSVGEERLDVEEDYFVI